MRSSLHRRGRRFVLPVALTAFVAACTSDGPGGGAGDMMAEAQPRQATYRCGDAGSVSIDNRRSSIRMTGATGEEIDLAAAPDSGGMRYIGEGLAVVLEGREALIMRNGDEPVSCMR